MVELSDEEFKKESMKKAEKIVNSVKTLLNSLSPDSTSMDLKEMTKKVNAYNEGVKELLKEAEAREKEKTSGKNK